MHNARTLRLLRVVLVRQHLFYPRLYIYIYIALTPFTNFTQVLNLRPVVFSLPPFGWLRSVAITTYFWRDRHFLLIPFWLTSTFHKRNWGIKHGLSACRLIYWHVGKLKSPRKQHSTIFCLSYGSSDSIVVLPLFCSYKRPSCFCMALKQMNTV